MVHTKAVIFQFVLTMTALVLLFSAEMTRSQDLSVAGEGESLKQDSAFVMSKSPGGAAVRSALIPGWGQLYTGSYWKVPIIYGIGGYLVYGWVTNNKDFGRYRDLYAESITAGLPSGNLDYKLYREFYRDRRDTYAWFFALLYLVQIADAFVDAHLYDFSVSADIAPVAPDESPGMTFRIHF